MKVTGLIAGIIIMLAAIILPLDPATLQDPDAMCAKFLALGVGALIFLYNNRGINEEKTPNG